MAKINIDGTSIETREGIPVLRAALEAGFDVPHYCYHPGLSVVASCRLCLMEMQMPHPQTREMSWSPKLMPSCQTPVKDGLVVRFQSDVVQANQKSCMEFFLLNHPLDCPVCDQAGECWLQDYSYKFGDPASRMVDQKLKNPKKDIGPHTLLYQDRCVLCSRCIRFTDEISGTHELCLVNRGSRLEVDVFPGLPLDNALQGNVVDLCPVGSLLDKDFLFKRRVWELQGASSVCPGCATGCTIRIDHADNIIQRIKPRANVKVNGWWMCDEGRYGYSHAHHPARITKPILKRGMESTIAEWDALTELLQYRFAERVRHDGPGRVGAMLSPFLSCEEAWLLIRFLKSVAKDVSIAMGPIPMAGDDQGFPVGAVGSAVKFTILKEKCPNARGVRKAVEASGVAVIEHDDWINRCASGDLTAVWIAGGYPQPWVEPSLAKALATIKLLVVQDMFPSELTSLATLVLPACSWAEREGSFVNAAGLLQPFQWAIAVPEGARRDGQFLFELAGCLGLYTGARVREMMSQDDAFFASLWIPDEEPQTAH